MMSNDNLTLLEKVNYIINHEGNEPAYDFQQLLEIIEEYGDGDKGEREGILYHFSSKINHIYKLIKENREERDFREVRKIPIGYIVKDLDTDMILLKISTNSFLNVKSLNVYFLDSNQQVENLGPLAEHILVF